MAPLMEKSWMLISRDKQRERERECWPWAYSALRSHCGGPRSCRHSQSPFVKHGPQFSKLLQHPSRSMVSSVSYQSYSLWLSAIHNPERVLVYFSAFWFCSAKIVYTSWTISTSGSISLFLFNGWIIVHCVGERLWPFSRARNAKRFFKMINTENYIRLEERQPHQEWWQLLGKWEASIDDILLAFIFTHVVSTHQTCLRGSNLWHLSSSALEN